MNVNDTITFVATKNSRRESAAGYPVFAFYKQGATIGAVIAAITAAGIGIARDHVRWDLNRGAIRVNDPATADDPAITAAILGGR